MSDDGFGERICEGFENRFSASLLHSAETPFQTLEVWKHPHFGGVLTLDGFVQTTEQDEFCYHEMLVHPVLCAREDLDRVLVIGGGDGGTLRRVLEHDPAEAVMCEIDEAVVDASRRHLSSVSAGAFEDERATVLFEDGDAYVRQHEAAFDAIIVDSTDPIGAAAVLFSQRFYAACRRALRADGLLVSQTGSPFHQSDELRAAVRSMRTAFASVEVYTGFVPTYPGVLWSFTLGTDGGELVSSASGIARRLADRGITTRFYTPEVHAAAFALPRFVEDLVSDA